MIPNTRLNQAHIISKLQFGGTWVQRNSSNIASDDMGFLIAQLNGGPLDRKGITYAVDRRPEGDILMIYDTNRTQKQAIDSVLKGKDLFTRFRYKNEQVTPIEDISLKPMLTKARTAMTLWEEAIADKSKIDVEKLMRAMVILREIPGFTLVGIKPDPTSGELKAENVLDWLRGADPEQVLRQIKAQWN